VSEMRRRIAKKRARIAKMRTRLAKMRSRIRYIDASKPGRRRPIPSMRGLLARTAVRSHVRGSRVERIDPASGLAGSPPTLGRGYV